MNIILGFGSTEKAFEQQEAEAIRAFAINKAKEMSADYVTSELAECVRQWCKARGENYREKANEYDEATNFPDRYSYFHSWMLNDASNIVIILTFMHTARRHALSPDGWALLQVKHLVHINALDDFDRTKP